MLSARGERVHVRPVTPEDVKPFRAAVAASTERIGRWNVVDPERVALDVAAQSPSRRTLMILANDPADAHGLVGRVNVTNMVRGTFQSASMGYDSYDPYAGRGLFREGLWLVVDLAFRASDDGGMGLHRVEANVQPGNARSAGVLRSLGFRHEGETPQMLLLPGADGRQAWRDHERYAVTAPEWPAAPFAPHRRSRRVVLVNGPATAASSELAAELAVPLLSRDVVGDALWDVLGGCPTGAVVHGEWSAADRPAVAAGLDRAGLEPAAAVEVWCARTSGEPLGLGPVVPLDPARPRTARETTALALDIRARHP